DYVTVRNADLRGLEGVADLIGARSSASMMAGDERAVRSTIAALTADGDVTRAYVFADDDRVFASYTRSDERHADAIPGATGAPLLTWNQIGIYRPITAGSKVLGSVF